MGKVTQRRAARRRLAGALRRAQLGSDQGRRDDGRDAADDRRAGSRARPTRTSTTTGSTPTASSRSARSSAGTTTPAARTSRTPSSCTTSWSHIGFASPVTAFKDLKLDSAPLTRTGTFNGKPVADLGQARPPGHGREPDRRRASKLRDALLDMLATKEVVLFNGHAGVSGRLLPADFRSTRAGNIAADRVPDAAAARRLPDPARSRAARPTRGSPTASARTRRSAAPTASSSTWIS